MIVEDTSTCKNNYKCCSCNCISRFSHHKIKELQYFFHSKSVSEQNQFLLNLFRLMSDDGSIQHMINGKEVCRKAYIKIFQMSEKRYKRIFKMFQQNLTAKVNRKPIIRKDSVKVSEAKAWMTRYFQRIGDSMPHMEQIHLPHGLTKRDVYYMMKGQLLGQGLNTVMSLSHFYAVWELSFKNVIIPKVSYMYSYIASYS